MFDVCDLQDNIKTQQIICISIYQDLIIFNFLASSREYQSLIT